MGSNRQDTHIGERYTNKHGEVVEVIKYNSSKDVVARCDNGYVFHTQMNNLKRGNFVRLMLGSTVEWAT